MSKGGFIKDAIILFIITLISGLCLGAVYEVTKEPIKQAQIAANKAAYREVFPDAADFQSEEALTEAAKASAEALADKGFGNVLVDDALKAVDAGGQTMGYVINSTSKDGYGGNVSISVGIKSDGTVLGIAFLSLSETAGLGMNAQNPDFKDQFQGKTAESLTVTKSGSAGDDEIDAMSGATITSNAVTNAVNAALYYVHNCVTQ